MFIQLVDQYLVPEPKGFALVASRLRQGMKPHQITNQIVSQAAVSKLAAGKLVEDCVRAVKIAKANQLSGVVGIFVGIGIVLTTSIVPIYGVMAIVLGVAQFSAGRRVWNVYKAAGLREHQEIRDLTSAGQGRGVPS
jgi:hypothetical protein